MNDKPTRREMLATTAFAGVLVAFFGGAALAHIGHWPEDVALAALVVLWWALLARKWRGTWHHWLSHPFTGAPR